MSINLGIVGIDQEDWNARVAFTLSEIYSERSSKEL